MKYFELDKSEKKLLKEFEVGNFRAVKTPKKEIVRYRQYTKNTLNKTRNINIRLSEGDLQKIKALAAKKGLPYQTLISSFLHEYSHSRRDEE